MRFKNIDLVCLLVTGFAMLTANLGPIQAQTTDEFTICSGPNRAERKVTCLVDGDTGWEHGKKWRLLGIDTPEYVPHAECAEEPEHAKIATFRVLELMRSGYEIVWIGEKGKANRELVHIKLSSGRDLGEILLSERLAQRWPNNTNPWCD